MEDDQTIKSTLNSVRCLIKSPQKYTLSEKDVLELTEDDLYDELDEDHVDQDDNLKISEKMLSINQMLTSIDDNQTKIEESSVDKDGHISKEVAVESAANIRKIINKMQSSENNNNDYPYKKNLEQVIIDSLKPYLNEWLEENVTRIIKRELEKLNENHK